jgi:hypothetical protein
MLVIAPMAVSGALGLIAMPSWIVVNGDYRWLTTQLGGLLTVGLGIVNFYFLLDTVFKRDPFDFETREQTSVE